jgi:hypothetical protein
MDTEKRSLATLRIKDTYEKYRITNFSSIY